MKPDSKPVEASPPLTNVQGHYATREEVENALRTLTDTDYGKLMLIAESFCNRRRLSPSAMEPKELLSEAVLKTLQLDKKWNIRISLVRHLDRAMENISGHLVRDLVKQNAKIIAFPDGVPVEPNRASDEQVGNDPDDELAAREEAESLLDAIFGDDSQARKIFVMRAQGAHASDIQTSLQLNSTQYETVARRIRRKISKFNSSKN